MAEPALDPDTNQVLIGRVLFMLKALHEAEKIRKRGYESASWRGQLGGFRCALEIIVGPEATSEILKVVREETRKSLGELAGDYLMQRAFPSVEPEHDNSGYMYVALGQHDKALDEGLIALERNPISARRYTFLVGCYILLNRLREAQALVEEAELKNIDSLGLHFCSYKLAFLNRDALGMEEQVAWGMGKPGIEDVMLSLQAGAHAFFGQLSVAREFSRRAISSAQQLGDEDSALRYQVDAALSEALFGNADAARQPAEFALRLSHHRYVKYKAALALGFAGDTANVKALIDDFHTTFPDEEVVQSNYLPTLNAQLALNADDAFKAIETLHAAPYELGNLGRAALFPVFLRGEAFLIAHKRNEAAFEFHKILDHPGIALDEPTGIRARLELAHSYAMQGDTAKASAAYQEFLALWKDADPDIPILKQAKAEYVKLQ